MTKLSPYICVYNVICPETGVGITSGSHCSAIETAPPPPPPPCEAIVLQHIGITWGLHLAAHETAHVKLLFCHTLALHGVYRGRFMKLAM